MYPGRSSGSRTIQGLTLKSKIEKFRLIAEESRARHSKWAARVSRAATIQNLASCIVITVATTAALGLAVLPLAQPARGPVLFLAAAATVCNTVLATRRHPEKAAIHFQIAKRYDDLAAACQRSITKYEECLVEDTGLQALLEQHESDLNALKRDAG